MDLGEFHAIVVGLTEYAKREMTAGGRCDIPPSVVALRNDGRLALISAWADDSREIRAKLWEAVAVLFAPEAISFAAETWVRKLDGVSPEELDAEMAVSWPGQNEALYQAGDPTVTEALTVQTVGVDATLLYTRSFHYDDSGQLVWHDVDFEDESTSDGWVLDMMRAAMATPSIFAHELVDDASVEMACSALAEVFNAQVMLMKPGEAEQWAR